MRTEAGRGGWRPQGRGPAPGRSCRRGERQAGRAAAQAQRLEGPLLEAQSKLLGGVPRGAAEEVQLGRLLEAQSFHGPLGDRLRRLPSAARSPKPKASVGTACSLRSDPAVALAQVCDDDGSWYMTVL
ncbi:hypothetical protein AB1E18_019638 [Capra hircus]